MELLEHGRGRRPYRQRARAEAAARTAERVMDAAVDLWRERWYDEITLQDIADRAGVSLSTVIRRFGSKAGIVTEILASDRAGTWAEREAVRTGDVDAALATLLAHYERDGDAVIRSLALEERLPDMAAVVRFGRELHRTWLARVFGPWLPRRRGPAFDRRLDQLVVATDVYTWKLLRRDRGLDGRSTERAMRELVELVLRPRPAPAKPLPASRARRARPRGG